MPEQVFETGEFVWGAWLCTLHEYHLTYGPYMGPDASKEGHHLVRDLQSRGLYSVAVVFYDQQDARNYIMALVPKPAPSGPTKE